MVQGFIQIQKDRLEKSEIMKGHLNAALISTSILLLSTIQPGSLAYGGSSSPKATASYTFTTFDLPGGGFPYSINNGQFISVDVPGALITLILGNNDRGQLTGGYVDASGVSHGFMATPAGGK